jgi:hypothetical protein
MRKLMGFAEHVLAAALALDLTADQHIMVLGMAARIISQRKGYRVQHASPVARGRRRLNEGFDRGAGYSREIAQPTEVHAVSPEKEGSSTR